MESKSLYEVPRKRDVATFASERRKICHTLWARGWLGVHIASLEALAPTIQKIFPILSPVVRDDSSNDAICGHGYHPRGVSPSDKCELGVPQYLLDRVAFLAMYCSWAVATNYRQFPQGDNWKGEKKAHWGSYGPMGRTLDHGVGAIGRRDIQSRTPE
ncbi:hypothetical protein DL93DRAFT_2093493 [Clavulina sp. PMI_390]|nr:hypothetical protein DL93DRAFT_2093493 [Clavulina sp. PMI_390]